MLPSNNEKIWKKKSFLSLPSINCNKATSTKKKLARNMFASKWKEMPLLARQEGSKITHLNSFIWIFSMFQAHYEQCKFAVFVGNKRILTFVVCIFHLILTSSTVVCPCSTYSSVFTKDNIPLYIVLYVYNVHKCCTFYWRDIFLKKKTKNFTRLKQRKKSTMTNEQQQQWRIKNVFVQMKL